MKEINDIKISYANSSVRLGRYTSKEKAIKVLDMIQESCIDCHIDFQMHKMKKCKTNYKMR